ncbi:GNAT family N-acetyltransferase [Oleidesulfovibrio sp.]|uniref:bifunctional acetate--CoA ligase family protein/GNAT family N-acetyltransferase n=1 Tax=Oleidesulfovibrio sp. TaxID=2909707 RepID=UPI003A881504
MNSSVLEQMFKPTSVAVIGATDSPGEPGRIVMENLLKGSFLGPVIPVNETREPVMGMESYSEIDTLPITPDLAVICSDAERTPFYLAELGKRGTQAVVLLSHGFFRFDRDKREVQRTTLMDIAKAHGMRVLGPNCLGFINPSIGINASLAHREALPGKIAFVSQSDSLFTSVLDWATSKGIGFSHFISLGDRYDINFADMLDYLNNDPNTRAVLLYLETITAARQFMSAARALARNKPVLVMKSGKSEAAASAAAAHSGLPLGSDDVYDTAFRRAGMLRVFDIDSLFDTVETLARSTPLKGDRLAILTNGGGPGFLATDTLLAGGGKLADLSEDSCQVLDNELRGDWSYWNPLVIKSGADGDMYARTLKVLLKDKSLDAVLVMHVPSIYANSGSVAESVAAACKKTKKVVLTSWLGIDDAAEARETFRKAGLPSFFTPDNAVRAFLNLVQYRRNQEMLVEAPPSLPENFKPDVSKARLVINEALDEHRQVLTVAETTSILQAYGITIPETRTVPDVHAAVRAAEEMGYPVALKVESPDIRRKTLAGGVALDLESDGDVLEAASAMMQRLRIQIPSARINGYTVQRMCRRANAHELLIETATDPVFGPIIRFGQGGPEADIVQDISTALPPLNMNLAGEAISRTRVSTRLHDASGKPLVDTEAIKLTLVKVSQLIIDIPEIFEMEINPLFVDEDGLVALDAHVRIAWSTATGAEQLAIRPYPREQEECARLVNGDIVDLRPIRPEDEPDHWEFLEHMSAQDRRFRFFGNVATLPRAEMVKLTQIDYDREMAFIAKGPSPEGEIKTLGVARAMIAPDNSRAEFAVAVRSDLKRQGLGRLLMDKIIRYLKSRGTERIIGEALADNKGMIELARTLGFEVTKDFDDDIFHFDMMLDNAETQEAKHTC